MAAGMAFVVVQHLDPEHKALLPEQQFARAALHEPCDPIFKLIPGDVGRLLSDIVCDLDYPDLMADAATVLATLVISDREIATTDNRWFQVKIMPYRTVDNVIDGVVITFSDITRAKRLETDLREYAGPDGRHR